MLQELSDRHLRDRGAIDRVVLSLPIRP